MITLCALILGIVGIVGVIYFAVPNEATIGTASSSSEIFGNYAWSVKIPKDLPREFSSFLCAVCYPEKIGSPVCATRMAAWVSRGISGSSHIQQRQIWDVLARARIGQAVELKYSHETISKLYFGFGAAPFSKTDIQQVCTERFQKNCDLLSGQELVDLELLITAPTMNLLESPMGLERHMKCDHVVQN